MIGFVSATPLLASHSSANAVSRRPRSSLSMRAEGTGKKKKVAPLQFAVDQRGKAVWSMRKATADDVPKLIELGGDVSRLGSAVLTAICNDGGCLCCEASVKGTKAGSGYVGNVLGSAVADVTMSVRDPDVGFESGMIKKAELLGADVSKLMEEPEEVKKTLILGLMKSMKAGGVDVMVKDAAESEVAEFKAMGFKTVKQGKRTQLAASLPQVNPMPNKKLS